MSESEPVDDASLSIQVLSKLGAPRNPKINRKETCLLFRWQSVYRRHELDLGFGTERGNLHKHAKGNNKWQTP